MVLSKDDHQFNMRPCLLTPEPGCVVLAAPMLYTCLSDQAGKGHDLEMQQVVMAISKTCLDHCIIIQ